MSLSIKKKTAKAKKIGIKASKKKLAPSVNNYINDPFFEKKADASKKIIDKYGFPKQLFK